MEKSLANRIFKNKKEEYVKKETSNDPINPNHYKTKSGLEVIDIIEAFQLDFKLGNAIKYILRAGKKDHIVQDLKKAIWYIERKIKEIENGKN